MRLSWNSELVFEELSDVDWREGKYRWEEAVSMKHRAHSSMENLGRTFMKTVQGVIGDKADRRQIGVQIIEVQVQHQEFGIYSVVPEGVTEE